MRKRQQNDCDAKAQRARPFRQRGQEQQRRRSNRQVSVEVLLDWPHRLESEGLGVDRLLERIAIALDRRLRTVTRQLIMEAKFHASPGASSLYAPRVYSMGNFVRQFRARSSRLLSVFEEPGQR